MISRHTSCLFPVITKCSPWMQGRSVFTLSTGWTHCFRPSRFGRMRHLCYSISLNLICQILPQFDCVSIEQLGNRLTRPKKDSQEKCFRVSGWYFQIIRWGVVPALLQQWYASRCCSFRISWSQMVFKSSCPCIFDHQLDWGNVQKCPINFQ